MAMQKKEGRIIVRVSNDLFTRYYRTKGLLQTKNPTKGITDAEFSRRVVERGLQELEKEFAA